MIKVFNDENNILNKEFFNKEELSRLNNIGVKENEKLSVTLNKISNYLCEKYSILGMFQLEDISISNDDNDIIKIYEKINKTLDRIS